MTENPRKTGTHVKNITPGKLSKIQADLGERTTEGIDPYLLGTAISTLIGSVKEAPSGCTV